MVRKLSTSNLVSQVFRFMPLEGMWLRVLGKQTREGCWIIYGAEKNGKTSFALMLANYLSTIENVLYISGEEGTGYTFTDACVRSGINSDNNRIHYLGYMSIDELKSQVFSNRKCERIVFIDNITVYKNELKDLAIKELMDQYPNTLFIFLAHEENREPSTAPGELCKKLAKVIIHITGLVAIVTARGSGEGGPIVIDPEKAALIHGDYINNQNTED